MNVQIGVVGNYPGGASDIRAMTGGITINTIPEMKKCNIIIFTGGSDVTPDLYGQENRYCMDNDLWRDTVEMGILGKAWSRGVKILGICRGHQFVNVGFGGTLAQDIRRELGLSHTMTDHWKISGRWKNRHLSKIFPTINTYHHQAVVTPGKILKPILLAKDGIIEACASEDGQVVTFQFHPEWMEEGKAYFQKVLETGNLIW